MIIKRLYDDGLAQASYLVGCAQTGEAVVIDPNRNITQYIEAAFAERLRITAVTETHIHADFASGSLELAHTTGATLYLSDEGDADWKYAFAHRAGAHLLRDGDHFAVGNLRFDVKRTPGHTPEHIIFIVTDTPATARPFSAFTGDFVFVGDVGRPDLLERAAGMAGTMEASARLLFRSLQRFKELPDYLLIFPGHGAGSACGKGLGGVPQSSVGYERLSNWALAVEDEDLFVREVLSGQPEPPPYFAEMKRLNKRGAAFRAQETMPTLLPDEYLPRIVESGAQILDVRPVAQYAAGHLQGAYGIELNKPFATYAGTVLSYDRPIYGVGEPAHAREVVSRLTLIGLDDVRGWLSPSAIQRWKSDGRPLASVSCLSQPNFQHALAFGAVALDVRGATEWAEGHVEGSINIPVGVLPHRSDELSRDREIAVYCYGGARSMLAVGILERLGFRSIVSLSGGVMEWEQNGLPLHR